MARYESQLVICKKHPNQNAQPGICPSCLRERLSEVAGNRYSRLSILDHNNSYDYFSSDDSPSVSGSPAYNKYSDLASARSRDGHHRIASDVMDSIYVAIGGNIKHGLKKSRSMVNLAHVDEEKKKRKGWFWNKLLWLRPTAKKSNEF